MAYKELFQPKDGGEKWTASLDLGHSGGYDLSLFLDTEKSTPESGYMFEIGINPDGTVIVQVTTRPGYDSAVLLVASPAQIKIESLYDDQQMVIVDPASDLPQPMTDKQKLAAAIEALRMIRRGAKDDGRWYDHAAYEALDGSRAEGPPEGYYDEDDPPEFYGPLGWIGDPDLTPDEPLKPAEWLKFDADEQTAWLETCARHAKVALERIGVPLVDPKEGQ